MLMSEKPKNLPQRKLPIRIIVIVVLALLLPWLCCGISLHFDHTPIALEMARSKWEAQNIRDYEMRLSFYSYSYVGDLSILVEDNQIVGMKELGSILGNYPSPIPIDLSQDPEWYSGTYGFSSYLAPSLQDYEVGRLFEVTETLLPDAPLVTLCNSQLHHEISFNQEYGFVEEINSSSCGTGLLCPIMSHCDAGFRVVEFIPASK
jgi:hypothetical protein